MIDEYIRLYGRRLYGLCLTLCADKIEADDLYQETWLKVLKNIDSYDRTMSFEPWVTRICVNTYRNVLRKIAKSPMFNGFSTYEEKDRVMDSVAAKEIGDYSDLHKAIRTLPEKLRITVVMYYFRDKDIKTVAQILNIPEGTVKSRLDRAKKLLRKELAEDGSV